MLIHFSLQFSQDRRFPFLCVIPIGTNVLVLGKIWRRVHLWQVTPHVCRLQQYVPNLIPGYGRRGAPIRFGVKSGTSSSRLRVQRNVGKVRLRLVDLRQQSVRQGRGFEDSSLKPVPVRLSAIRPPESSAPSPSSPSEGSRKVSKPRGRV